MLFLFFKHDWFNYILSWLLTLTSAFNAHLGIAFHSHNQAAVLLLLFGEPKEILLLLIMFSYTETSLNHIMLIIMILVIKSSDILNYESEKMYLRHTVFCLHLYYRVETIKGFFLKKTKHKISKSTLPWRQFCPLLVVLPRTSSLLCSRPFPPSQQP